MQRQSHKSKKGSLKPNLECWPGALYMSLRLKAKIGLMDWALGLNAQVGVPLSQEWGQENVIVLEHDRICTTFLAGHIKYFRGWCMRRVTFLAMLPPEHPSLRRWTSGLYRPSQWHL